VQVRYLKQYLEKGDAEGRLAFIDWAQEVV
jgi:hypothetical protein